MSSSQLSGPPDTNDSEPYAPKSISRLGEISREEREAAVRESGPPWKEWLFSVALKWWMGLLWLILDAWIVAGWIEVGGWLELAASLAAAVFLEYLLYQYLWHPYDPEFRGRFRRSLGTPFEVGRWVPERSDILAGKTDTSVPDLRQFQ